MNTITELPLLLEGRIFRSVMPFGHYDPQGQVLDRLLHNGVSTMVVLASRDEMVAKAGRDLIPLYRRLGLQVIHLPVEDFGVPQLDGLRGALANALTAARSGKYVAVHCSAGI